MGPPRPSRGEEAGSLVNQHSHGCTPPPHTLTQQLVLACEARASMLSWTQGRPLDPYSIGDAAVALQWTANTTVRGVKEWLANDDEQATRLREIQYVARWYCCPLRAWGTHTRSELVSGLARCWRILYARCVPWQRRLACHLAQKRPRRGYESATWGCGQAAPAARLRSWNTMSSLDAP